MLEDSLGSTFVLFIVFLLVIAGAYFSTKYLSVKSAGFQKGKYMQVKERLPLGRDKYVALVQAGGKYFIIGVCAQSMQILGAVEEGELTPIPQDPTSRQTFPSFKDWMLKAKQNDTQNGSLG